MAGGAFSPDAFDSAAFDIGIGEVENYHFGTGLRWQPIVIIAGIDVSDRLSGTIVVSGGENSARVATLSLTPVSEVELDSFDSSSVTIDYRIVLGDVVHQKRRFTGKVHHSTFDPYDRRVDLECRDAWQETPKSKTSASQVEQLFGGLHTASALIRWDQTAPDPVSYFEALKETVAASLFIDADGVWSQRPWNIGQPAITLTAADVFDGSVKLSNPSRNEVLEAITASLLHRYKRLHNAEVSLSWTAPDRSLYVTRGIPVLLKSLVFSALDGLADWHVKG